MVPGRSCEGVDRPALPTQRTRKEAPAGGCPDLEGDLAIKGKPKTEELLTDKAPLPPPIALSQSAVYDAGRRGRACTIA